jgi:hypothetical protein
MAEDSTWMIKLFESEKEEELFAVHEDSGSWFAIRKSRESDFDKDGNFVPDIPPKSKVIIE